MSAVKEWFGVYNIVFKHIRETYGMKELDQYIKYIADEANSDISEQMRGKPVRVSAEWFAGNFTKDGADFDLSESDGKAEIAMRHCAAFDYMEHSTNPYDKPDDYYCHCCKKLNEQICANAGITLDIADADKKGKCRWTFSKEDK